MEAKISAIKEFNRPKTKKDIRELLGLAGYYRKFIKNFAERSVLLTGTLGGKRPEVVDWDQGLEEEFQGTREQASSQRTRSGQRVSDSNGCIAKGCGSSNESSL